MSGLRGKGRAIIYQEESQYECIKLSLLDLSEAVIYSAEKHELIGVPTLHNLLSDNEIESELVSYLIENYPKPLWKELFDIQFNFEVTFTHRQTPYDGWDDETEFEFIIKSKNMITDDEQALDKYFSGEAQNESNS